MTERKEKITWTLEERQCVADQWALFRFDDPFDNTTNLLKRAQEKALPEARWRQLKNFAWSLDPKLKSMVLKSWQLLLAGITKVETEIVYEQMEPPPVDVTKVINQAPLPELCATAVRRLLTEHFTSQQKTDVGMKYPTPPFINPNFKPATNLSYLRPEENTSKKIKIGLITIIRDQANYLNGKCPDDVEIVYLDREKNPKPNLIPKSAVAIICHKASHSWMGIARNEHHNVIYENGGINSLVKLIYAIRSKEIARRNNVKTMSGK